MIDVILQTRETCAKICEARQNDHKNDHAEYKGRSGMGAAELLSARMVEAKACADAIRAQPTVPTLTAVDEATVTVIRRMATRLAELEREDIIGALMKVGAFRELGDDGIVVLARWLEGRVP